MVENIKLNKKKTNFGHKNPFFYSDEEVEF